MTFIPANPAVCPAALVLPEGQAYCELPTGHVGPHRASGLPHAPTDHAVAWELQPPLRFVLLRGEHALGAA
jgi:hypothetical protein